MFPVEKNPKGTLGPGQCSCSGAKGKQGAVQGVLVQDRLCSSGTRRNPVLGRFLCLLMSGGLPQAQVKGGLLVLSLLLTGS